MLSYTNQQLDQLSSIIEARTGLNTYERHRQHLIQALQQEGIIDLQAYYVHLSLLSESHPIWQALLSEITIGETYFMRDKQQIALLRNDVLPSIIDAHRQDKRIRLWSAGCASGEEAYTLAILLHELLPDFTTWDIEILATDINDRAITAAQRGVYGEWSFRNTDPRLKLIYFSPHGDQYVIRNDLKEIIRFRQDNLVNTEPEPQDLIICRNVMFYFTPEQVKIAERRLLQALHPAGWLLLSPAETINHVRSHFQMHVREQTIVFQRQSAQEPITPRRSEIKTLPPQGYEEAVSALQHGDIDQADLILISMHNTPDVQALRASIALSRGQIDTAQNHLKTVLTADPFHSEAHYLMGLLHLEQNDQLAARTSLRAAIYCRPRFALAHLLSGDLYMKQGDYSRAARAWRIAREFAAEHDPDAYLSNITDVTAAQLKTLVDHRLT